MRSDSNAPGAPVYLVASDVQAPVVRGSPVAAEASRAHQERATRLVREHGGRILVRVGQGCVATVPDLEEALLLAARLTHPGSRADGSPTYPTRAAVHRAPVGEAPTPLAEPGVGAVRTLLDRAGPGEILLSPAFYEALPEPKPQATPLLGPAKRTDRARKGTAEANAPGGAEAAPESEENAVAPGAEAPAAPEAYRLLWRPDLSGSQPNKPLRSGLLVGVALLLLVLLAVVLIALGLLAR